MTAQSLVEFKRVEKRFGDTVAVEAMDFDIRKGEFLAIMGSSGCGKTTTLRMLAGLEQPTAGEIFLDGKRVDNLRPEERDLSTGSNGLESRSLPTVVLISYPADSASEWRSLEHL